MEPPLPGGQPLHMELEIYQLSNVEAQLTPGHLLDAINSKAYHCDVLQMSYF